MNPIEPPNLPLEQTPLSRLSIELEFPCRLLFGVRSRFRANDVGPVGSVQKYQRERKRWTLK